jgi:hypothetical protein
MALDEAAQHVINTLDAHIKNLIQAEREACADIAENWNCNGAPRVGVAAQIRARSQA